MVEQLRITDEEALAFHYEGKPGKVEINPTKPLMTQRDLSLGYSPGVAVPCLKIQEDPNTAYDYTARGNFVAVISNGTAVLGLGNLGALASKPVMEGKAILFKRFADIDGIDLEVDTTDVDEFVNCVRLLGPTWGGINLEDIAAPDCFVIEQRLRELMDIPVFHDDQHGTAIIATAGMINAAYLSGKKFEDLKVVVLGAGAAGIACLELIKTMGVKQDNALLVDREGVIYKGRETGMNQWKSAHAANTDKRTLAEAMEGADVFLGLASKDAVTPEMVKTMAPNPIIFAMANPDPEIRPEVAKAARSDAIIATGRSDYPNQVNNVMGFPYIFRGALDVRASQINEEMKIAAAQALAKLAREDVPDEVTAAYGRKMKFGPEYIIPAPFDPRLITTIPAAVAKAAMDSGVARKPIENMEKYKQELKARRDPTANTMSLLFDKVKAQPQRMIFAEGEEERVIRAAIQWRDNGFGEPVLVGRVEKIEENMKLMGVTDASGIRIANALIDDEHIEDYVEYLYAKLQRNGFLHRDIVRMVKNDRNIFASCMLACGQGDAMVTGLTRNYYRSFDNVRMVIPEQEGEIVFGLSMLMTKGRTVFIADTTVNELPSAEQLADIACAAAEKARQMGHEPRVALLSFSNFGNPMREKAQRIREAAKILEERKVDFQWDGEMSADVALNKELLALYPFCRLKEPANVLVMPALHSAAISSTMLHELGDVVEIGPILHGLSLPVQIAPMGSTVSEIVTQAVMAALDAIEMENRAAPHPLRKKA